MLSSQLQTKKQESLDIDYIILYFGFAMGNNIFQKILHLHLLSQGVTLQIDEIF